ncbi:BCCT family transporter [Vibrio lentus]|nr:BCCT family transporter [Vibrio lentus]
MDGFRWMAIIFCTLLAGGGVFWAAARPIAHYVNPPPLYGAQENAQQRRSECVITIIHTGFPRMGNCGQLNVYRGYAPSLRQGLPLKPRILLYPVLGEKSTEGHTGTD